MSTQVTLPGGQARAIKAGAGTDQLAPGPSTVEAASRTYREELATAGVAR